MPLQKRRVRIKDTPTMTVVDDHEISDLEREAAWWSLQDLDQVKDSVKRQCRFHRQHRRYSDCLTDAYQTACLNAMGVTANGTGESTSPNPSNSFDTTEVLRCAVLVENQDEMPLICNASREGLLLWVSDEGPRGLESYSSRLHSIRRQRHLQATKHAVFLEQARQNLTNQHDDNLLARSCAQSSQRARSFAALLGQVDEYVANNFKETASDTLMQRHCEADGA